MKIRKVTTKDLEDIDKIYVEGSIDEGKLQFPKVSKKEMIKNLEKHRKNRLKGFKDGILSNKDYWVVAIEKGKIISFGQAEIKNYEDDSNYCEVEKIYVKREFRGMGVGKKLENGLFYWLKNKGTKKVFARMYAKNSPSIKLHSSLGFEDFSITMMKRLK